MFTKPRNYGFFTLHPLCGMLLGILAAIGALMLLLTKRHSLATAARRMAEAVENCAEG